MSVQSAAETVWRYLTFPKFVALLEFRALWMSLLNKWSAITYTHDKSLFYMIQRRRARREKLERQDWLEELAYGPALRASLPFPSLHSDPDAAHASETE